MVGDLSVMCTPTHLFISMSCFLLFRCFKFCHSSIFYILQVPADMAQRHTFLILELLDGELWSWEPGLLVHYHKNLQTTLLHPDSKMTLSDLEASSSTVQWAVHAWKWTHSIIQTQKNTGTKLLVAPTVQNELTDALQVCCTCMYICSNGFGVDSLFSPQFRENTWKCCEEVGIEELDVLSCKPIGCEQCGVYS